MSIRNKLVISFMVAGSTFAFSEAASAQADSFKIASTSYSQPLTQVESIIGGKKSRRFGTNSAMSIVCMTA